MSATEVLTPTARYRLREFHSFEALDARFVYLVPSGAIFALNKIGGDIIDQIGQAGPTSEELVEFLLHRGYPPGEIDAALTELEHSEVIICGDFIPVKPEVPVKRFPLQRIVLNITNQCNLACTYCYEYSPDKISKTEGKPKYMPASIAEASINMLIKESGDRPAIHVTFFGGETLLNFPMLRSSVEYAKRKCSEASKQVEFNRLYSIGEIRLGNILEGFEDLAWEYRDWAIAGRHHGFTNVNDTLKELHWGSARHIPAEPVWAY